LLELLDLLALLLPPRTIVIRRMVDRFECAHCHFDLTVALVEERQQLPIISGKDFTQHAKRAGGDFPVEELARDSAGVERHRGEEFVGARLQFRESSKSKMTVVTEDRVIRPRASGHHRSILQARKQLTRSVMDIMLSALDIAPCQLSSAERGWIVLAVSPA